MPHQPQKEALSIADVYGRAGCPAHIYLIRHGETVWNKEGRIQGWQDTELSDLGRRQAEALRPRLAVLDYDAVYTSDLKRCVDTARIALNPCPVGIRAAFQLRELGKGTLEGRFGKELSNSASHGTETLEQALGRVESFLDYLLHWHNEQTVLLFTHGGIIKVLLHRLTGKPFAELDHLTNRNTGVYRIDVDGRGRGELIYADNVEHLKAID